MELDIKEFDFTAPAVSKDNIFEYTYDGKGLTILVFFPGAFTDVCTKEVCDFRDSMAELNDLGAEVLGISVDTPFSLDEFREQYNLNFKLISDTNKEIIDQYDVRTDFMDIGYNGLAKRAVFIIRDKQILYKEIMDNPENLPDMEKLKEKLAEIEGN